MKKILGCSGVVLFLVGGILTAVTLACILTVAVPYFNHSVLQDISCPPNTTLVTEWITTSYTHPGEQVLSAYCLDGQGNQLQTKDIGYGALAYYPKYLGISLAIAFATGIFILIPIILIYQVIKRRSQRN